MAGPEDSAIIKEIRKTIHDALIKSKPTETVLQITIACSNGKNYRVEFKVSICGGLQSKSGEDEVEIYNPCVYAKLIPGSCIYSMIRANVREPSCFTPRLESYKSNIVNRMTSVDVLQVLKTKLFLMIPGVEQISLDDAATIDSVVMTPYRILRGGEPFYTKYGYENSVVQQIQAFLVTLHGSDLLQISEDAVPWHDRIRQILQTDGQTFEDIEPLTEIMKKISFKTDGETHISYNLLNAILQKHAAKFNIPSDFSMNLFQLNKESSQWKEWRQKVVITDAVWRHITPKGGKQKTRRQRKKRPTRRRH